MCGMHYMRTKRHGSPAPYKGCLGTPREKFERIGWTVTAGNCWEWSGSRNEDGYGLFRMSSRGMQGAHRCCYLIYVGQLTSRQVVRHTCDNPPCVNPSHLLVGTVADNVTDCVVRGRRSPQQGERNNRAKLTWADVREIRAIYAAGGVSTTALAQQYGVSQPAVSQIILRKTWREPVEV